MFWKTRSSARLGEMDSSFHCNAATEDLGLQSEEEKKAMEEKAEEMKSRLVFNYSADKSAPAIRLEDLAALDRLRNELCTLCKNLTGAERIVSYLGVTHIVIRRQTYRSTVRLDSKGGIITHNSVKRGSIGACNRISAVIGSNTYAIHNDGEKRALNSLKFS